MLYINRGPTKSRIIKKESPVTDMMSDSPECNFWTQITSRSEKSNRDFMEFR